MQQIFVIFLLWRNSIFLESKTNCQLNKKNENEKKTCCIKTTMMRPGKRRRWAQWGALGTCLVKKLRAREREREGENWPIVLWVKQQQQQATLAFRSSSHQDNYRNQFRKKTTKKNSTQGSVIEWQSHRSIIGWLFSLITEHRKHWIRWLQW